MPRLALALALIALGCSGARRLRDADDVRDGARPVALHDDRATIRGEIDAARDPIDWIRIDAPAHPCKLVVELRHASGADVWITFHDLGGSLSPKIERAATAPGSPATFQLDPSPRTVYARIGSKTATVSYELGIAFIEPSHGQPDVSPPPEPPRDAPPRHVDPTTPPTDISLPCEVTGDRPRFPHCEKQAPAPQSITLRIVRVVQVAEGVRITLDGGSRRGITIEWRGNVIDDKTQRPMGAVKLTRVDTDDAEGIVHGTYDQFSKYRTARVVPPAH